MSSYKDYEDVMCSPTFDPQEEQRQELMRKLDLRFPQEHPRTKSVDTAADSDLDGEDDVAGGQDNNSQQQDEIFYFEEDLDPEVPQRVVCYGLEGSKADAN